MKQATIWNSNTGVKATVNLDNNGKAIQDNTYQQAIGKVGNQWSLWTGGTATGAEAKQAIINKANPIVSQPVKPIDNTQPNNIDSSTLKTGMTTPDISGSLQSGTASDLAYKSYIQNTKDNATQTSNDIQKNIDAIKAQQIKDEQANVEKANQATANYNAGVQPEIDIYKQNLANQTAGLNSVYTADYYTSIYTEQKQLTQDIVDLSNLGSEQISNASGGATLASVATGRTNAFKADIQSKIDFKQSALTAISGRLSTASTILENGISKLDDYYTKQLNFQKLAQDTFKTDPEIKSLTEKSITDLEAKKKTLDDTQTAIENLLSDPTTAVVASKANVLLTDTPEQIATKLNDFYVKNPQYSPDNIKTNQALITKYPDAGIIATDTSAIVQSKLANSKIYQNETNNKNNYLEVGTDENGNKIYYDTVNKKIVNSNGGIVGGYDISSYATDPNHETSVANILSSIGDLKTTDDIINYIKKVAPNSPITAEMIQNTSQKYGVSWEMLIAMMQQDSSLGTAGKGARTHNPGNVGNNDSGNLVDYGNWQSGVDAVGNWLNNHRTTSSQENNFNFSDTEKRDINNAISAGLLSKDATGQEKYNYLNKDKNLTTEEKSFQTDLNKALDDLAKGGDWGDNWNYLKKRYDTPDTVLDQLLQKDKYYPKEKKSGVISSLWNKFWGK